MVIYLNVAANIITSIVVNLNCLVFGEFLLKNVESLMEIFQNLKWKKNLDPTDISRSY